jgi:iron complex transport system substrate-binding protein
MRIKIPALALATLLGASLVAACSADADPQAAPSTATAAKTAPTTRTVVDMAGRTVTLPDEITSVATFGSIGVLNAFVETMGQGGLICNQGSAGFVNSPSWAKYQYKFAPQIENLPEFENADREIIMENVLAASPDVSLTMSTDYTEQLEAQGLAVVQLDWQQQDDVKTAITLLGEVFDVPDRAEDYLNYFDGVVQEAEGLTADVTDRKKVLYGSVADFSQPHVIAEWWIAQAGGDSVTSEAIEGQESLTYTLEDLLLWAPDVILLSSAGEKEDILADGRLTAVPAVQTGQIYALPRVAHTWGNRTTEQPLTILWTLNKLYPDLYSEDELAEDIEYFYEHFFSYQFAGSDLEEIITG